MTLVYNRTNVYNFLKLYIFNSLVHIKHHCTYFRLQRRASNIRVVISKRSSGLSEKHHSNGGDFNPRIYTFRQLYFETSDMLVSKQLLVTLSINLYLVKSQIHKPKCGAKSIARGIASGIRCWVRHVEGRVGHMN